MEVAAIAPVFVHVSDKRRKNVWHTLGDGAWSNFNIWLSNAMSPRSNYNYPGQSIPNPIFPNVGDDVYVNHAVVYDPTNVIINNLFISGSLNTGTLILFVNGNLQSTGALTLSSGTIHLFGAFNSQISSTFTKGTGTMRYARTGYQEVMDLSYHHLYADNPGVKNIGFTTILSGNLNVQAFATLELSTFDLTITGTTTIGSGIFKKSGAGSIVFVGAFSHVYLGAVNPDGNTGLQLLGNPSVEVRGGGTLQVNAVQYLGTGLWSFTTANQTLTLVSSYYFFTDVLIASGIELSIASTGFFAITNSVTGASGTSKLINKGNVYFWTSTAPMLTGVFDITSFANSVGYVMTAAFTVPLTAYSGLAIGGTGTKTLSGSTTLTGALQVLAAFAANGTNLGYAAGTLELSTFNLTVTGATTIGSAASFMKGSAGSILFIGLLTNNGIMNLSGNPSVELRGGVANIGTSFAPGGGVWTFSTNNQSYNPGGSGLAMTAAIMISGAITLTLPAAGAFTNFIFDAEINGNNAGSTLDSRGGTGSASVQYKSPIAPMTTGVLQCNAGANIWKYNRAGNQDVKGTTYRTLEFGGSGVKTLLGNVVVNTTAGGSWSITGTATINYNGFTITTI